MPEVASTSLRKNAVVPRILHALLREGGRADRLTFALLASEAGVSKKSMTTAFGRLSADRIVVRDPLRFGPGAGLVLALAAGGENSRAALVDLNGAVLVSKTAEADISQLEGPPSRLLGRLKSLAIEVLDEALAREDLCFERGLPIIGVALALPSPIGRDHYVHGAALDDPRWHGVTVREQLRQALGGPFGRAGLGGSGERRLDVVNDANAGVLAAAFDISRARAGGPVSGHSEIVMAIHLGSGIGAGVMQLAPYMQERRATGSPEPAEAAIIHSRLAIGSNGLAGELGHLPISESILDTINELRPAGLARLSASWECACRQKGHLQALASARALARRLGESDGFDIRLDQPIGPQLAKLVVDDPDERVRRALHDTGRLLGRALTSPILMLDPASIILTGYLARPEVVEGINREQHAWSARPQISYLSQEASDEIALRGAALIMLRTRIYKKNLHDLADASSRDKLFLWLGNREVRAMEADQLAD